MKIHFLGAAGTVTGSKFLIESTDFKILIDCGLFQGLKDLRNLNWEHLPVNPSEIDAVFLTHGHMDHTGYLPRLAKYGFYGPVYGTSPTLDIAEVILRDSAKINEEEAERANAEGYSKHDPALPLYTIEDAEMVIHNFSPLTKDKWLEPLDGLQIKFNPVGHIVGACFLEIKTEGKTLVFSGDIGREDDILLFPPQKPDNADYVFIESTYGNRLHPTTDIETELKNIVLDTIENGGNLIIPSFAVERTQTVMYLLWKLYKENKIPHVPMVMDSPMGKNVLDIFHHHQDWHKLDTSSCMDMCRTFKIVSSYKETWETIKNKTPKIIVAGSGMLSGGRVLTYLQQMISKENTTVLMVGYQAEGTRGRKLLEGADEIKLFGKYYPVKARIENIQGLSAHADQKGLLNWLSEIKQEPKEIFVIHGEQEAALTLQKKIAERYDWNVTIPELYEIKELI